jgi:phosphatidylserine/phosphatidylglycerophosphate/cardiolipin synthase-like enzyme
MSAPSKNLQGSGLRKFDQKTPEEVTLSDGTGVTVWFSPNTDAVEVPKKNPATPPDLADVFSRMRKAQDIILFAVFLPSVQGKHSIVEEAITLGQKDPKLMVYGAVSDPKAMPNYTAPPKQTGNGGNKGAKPPSPAIFDSGRTHVVLAKALMKGDLMGNFEAEILSAGHAIIHDKIVVVDPLSDAGFVVMGSHNLGYKAASGNDENLLILRNNRALVQAYAVHVLDVYDHYRFRAVQAQVVASKTSKKAKVAAAFDGFLSRDSKWMADSLSTERGDLARYFAGVPTTASIHGPAALKKKAGV